jgi:carbon-monoxide dehydrogenase medium subunit
MIKCLVSEGFEQPPVKPPVFSYEAPLELSDALDLMSRFGSDAKVLAGGQTLVPQLNRRLVHYQVLIDINRIDSLAGIARVGDNVVIGAMTRHSDILNSDIVRQHCPLVHEVTGHIGHFQVRNRATLGGSLAHADPAGELPCAAVALDALLTISSSAGQHVVAARDFFLAAHRTVLGEDELIVEVSFRRHASSGIGVAQMSPRHGDLAVTGALCVVDAADGVITSVAICLMGMDSIPYRATVAETALEGMRVEKIDCTAVGRSAVRGAAPVSDLRASAAYRERVGAIMVTRALEQALSSVGGPS